MELRYLQPVLHGEHAGGVAEDPLSLGEGAREDARIVGQEDAREPECPGHVEEMGRLVGRRAVDRARHHARIVGHDGDAPPAQLGQGGDDRSPERRLDHEQRAVVDDRLKHRADRVRAAGGSTG